MDHRPPLHERQSIPGFKHDPVGALHQAGKGVVTVRIRGGLDFGGDGAIIVKHWLTVSVHERS
ncbi:MAG: hypothetical protein SPJ78_03880, partial [Corynebacterium camporealensis]|uniref:hypothetical protein n=1 Tax=Corynebacterium camporealensis TaxID=161896 RepID=UPI002A910D59